MRPMLIFAATLVAGAHVLAPPAAAQASPDAAHPACDSHEKVVTMLDQQYSEALKALGLQADGQLVQVFVSDDGASWTIVTTRPDGLTCIIAAGEHWESVLDAVRSPIA